MLVKQVDLDTPFSQGSVARRVANGEVSIMRVLKVMDSVHNFLVSDEFDASFHLYHSKMSQLQAYTQLLRQYSDRMIAHIRHLELFLLMQQTRLKQRVGVDFGLTQFTKEGLGGVKRRYLGIILWFPVSLAVRQL